MDIKTIRRLKWSFLAVVALCITVFLLLTVNLSSRVQHTIGDVSEFYMTAMNQQLQHKFSLAIELTSEKLDGVIHRDPPANAVYGDELLDHLRTSARVRDFVYLGFLRPDGSLETVYGSDQRFRNARIALASLENTGRIAATGLDENGDHCLLLGCAAGYPLGDGTESIALVAGISTDHLSEVIFADTDNETIFSHIIDVRGNYVLRTHLPGSVSPNYLDYVQNEMQGITPEEAASYLDGIRNALDTREFYATTITVDGEARRVYCDPLLENDSWFLITVMPSGFLDATITRLDRERMILMAAASLAMVAALTLFFFFYYRHSLKQMELLRQAQEESARANSAKSTFLSSMSHDIRTPINAVIGMSEIALRHTEEPERIRDCIYKIELSSRHLLGLINDILDISKIESGKMELHCEETSLRETLDGISSIIQPQAKARGQQFEISIRDLLAEKVWCDGVRLNQVFLNLLSNALKFTPEGGSIGVLLLQEPSPKGEEYVRTHIRVQDTGMGISPEFQEHLFDSFSREASSQIHHTTGTGLGMAITKRIVDLMEGGITVDSSPGQGTCFHIQVDLKKLSTNPGSAEDEKNEAALPKDDDSLRGKRVLLAEDNELNWEIAEELLCESGLILEHAWDGRECVEMFLHSEPGYYDAILMDIQMPNLNGYEATEQIRSSGRPDAQTPIIAMTADAFAEDISRCLECGMNHHLSKPLNFQVCRNVLKQYVGK